MEGDTPTNVASTTATTASSVTSLTAEELLPDLSSIGLGRSEVQRTPFSQIDEAGVLYGEPTSTTPAIKLIVYVLADEAAGGAHFAELMAAYEDMPVAALLADPLSVGDPEGQPPANDVWAEGPGVAEEAAYFRTKEADRTGQQVWTDVYRIGNVAVVVQVLSRDEPIAKARREATIEAIVAKLAGG